MGSTCRNLLLSLLLTTLFFLSCAPARESSAGPDARDLWRSYFKGKPLPEPAFRLAFPGASIFMDLTQYGEMTGAGGEGFAYVVKDADGLKQALGEGIDPNLDVYKDPDYKKMNAQGLLKGSYWELLRTKEYQRTFFTWTQAPEDPGVRLFFTAKTLENAGLIEQAVKAYYASAVFHPKAAAWGADHSFVWYTAPAALSQVKRLCRDYPDLECELEGASFDIRNGEDTDLKNDVVKFNPGRIVRRTVEEKIKALPDLRSLPVAATRGSGKVKLVKYANGHWQMLVDGRPFYIKGITYWPTEVGLGPEKDPNAADRWMRTDKNNNGLIDAAYESWTDDGRKPIGDFALLKELGINAIRLYAPNNPGSAYDPALMNKPLLRDLYQRFGIRVIVGDFLGAYTLGSGASWDQGTDYTDPEQRARMKAVVRAKVLDLKDEPFVLMWVLGNENNLPAGYMGVCASRTNAASQPEAYARFLNEVAEMVHELDPDHPVAVGNLVLGLVDHYNKYAPALDIMGVNSYPGADGFGRIFEEVRQKFDRPVLVTEYGADAYTDNQGPDEDRQLDIIKGEFHDLVYNKPGGPGAGNAIGGVIFEWLDEWWKAPNDPDGDHSIEHQEPEQTPDGYFHQEWLGIAGQGDGKASPFERRLRKAYFYLKDVLNKVPGE